MNKSALYLIKGIFVWFLFGVNLSYSQQDVYWRGDTSASNWWDSLNPWYYQSWGNTQNRPDNNSGTRNFVFFDNNNQTTTTVNGAFFALNTMTVQSSANLARIYNGSSGGGISLTGGIYINSSANQNFNVDIGVDGSNVSFMGHSGSSIITFANNFYLNGNTATFGGNSASTGIVVSGIAQGTGGKMVKNDSNTLTLSGANTFTGGLTINAGTVLLNHASAPGTGTLTIAGGAIDNTTGAAITLANNNAQNWNGNFTFTGTRDLNLGTGAVAMNASREVTVNGTRTLTVGGAISGSTFGLTKLGGGILALSGANTYTGITAVNTGILAVANANALGSTAGGTTVASGAVLYLNGVTVGNEALTISGSGGALSTAGALRAGTGANTYGGKVTLAADAKIFSGSGTSMTLDVATGDAVDLASYTLTIDGSGTHTVKDSIFGTGGLTKMGSGTTTLEGNNTYSGATDIQAGKVILSGAGRLGSGAISVANANGGSLEFAVSGSNVIGNSISGNGSLLSSSGATQLNGSVTSTGGLTVNTSTVRVGNSGSITTATTVNNGGTLDVGGTAGSVQVNSGGLLKGSGSAGAVTLQSGSLLNPGNSPGTLTAASATVLGGSTYNWEISALTGTAGTTWDLFSVGGLLNMDGVTSGNKWNLVVTGDSGFAGWTDTSSYSYVFAQAASVSGFSSTVGTDVTSLFNITTSGISSKPNASFNVNGDFKVVVGSANGFTTLNLMAVPEPSSGSLLLAGIGSLIVLRRFRKKA